MNTSPSRKPMIPSPVRQGVGMGNISISSNIPDVKTMPSDLELRSSNHLLTGSAHTPRVSSVPASPLNGSLHNTMETLCDSMKRSAMTRNLVKQLSNRSVHRQYSGQNAGYRMAKRGMDDSGHSAHGTVPIRRSSSGTKHRMGRDALSVSLHAQRDALSRSMHAQRDALSRSMHAQRDALSRSMHSNSPVHSQSRSMQPLALPSRSNSMSSSQPGGLPRQDSLTRIAPPALPQQYFGQQHSSFGDLQQLRR